MIRSTVARVDLAALKHNFAAIRSFVSRSAEPSAAADTNPPAIIGVVKANAYGHGAPRVALALEEAGVTMLACADIEEGIVLRQAGVRAPILVFGALSVSDLDGLFEFELTPTISTPGAARAVQAAADRRRTTIAYHLKIDTGMNRLGFRHDNLRRTLPELLASPNLKLVSVYTHFASADEPESPVFNEQRERFEKAWTIVQDLLSSPAARSPKPGVPVFRHACNSAGLLRDSRVWHDAVRPGLLLYGIVPPPLASTIDLVPVMSLTSRVVAVKGLRPGEGVGYGGRYRADRAKDRRRGPCRLRRRTRYAIVRARPRLDSGPARADRGRGVDGHADRRRQRSRQTCDQATRSCSSGSREPRAGSASTRARWLPLSAPSRGRSSAASARGLKDNTLRTSRHG